jgi:hypothetical protein
MNNTAFQSVIHANVQLEILIYIVSLETEYISIYSIHMYERWHLNILQPKPERNSSRNILQSKQEDNII